MKIIIIFVAILIVGCTTGLNSIQHQELISYESKGLLIEEKNTGTATALGLLPGGGSFYTRQYGLGILNLLVWPYSVLWDPINGYRGAQEINYYATVANCNNIKNREISDLDTLLMTKQIDNNEYIIKKHSIENKFGTTENKEVYTKITPAKASERIQYSTDQNLNDEQKAIKERYDQALAMWQVKTRPLTDYMINVCRPQADKEYIDCARAKEDEFISNSIFPDITAKRFSLANESKQQLARKEITRKEYREIADKLSEDAYKQMLDRIKKDIKATSYTGAY